MKEHSNRPWIHALATQPVSLLPHELLVAVVETPCSQFFADGNPRNAVFARFLFLYLADRLAEIRAILGVARATHFGPGFARDWQNASAWIICYAKRISFHMCCILSLKGAFLQKQKSSNIYVCYPTWTKCKRVCFYASFAVALKCGSFNSRQNVCGSGSPASPRRVTRETHGNQREGVEKVLHGWPTLVHSPGGNNSILSVSRSV